MSWKALLVKLLSVLLRPGWRARCVGVPVCRLLRALAPRKNVARRNIAIALPDASDAQRRAVLSGTYDNLVWTGLEFIMLQRDPRQVLEWVEAEGDEILESCRGRGAILLTGHVGNWELTAAWVAQRGHRLTAIVRESDDRGERGLIEGMRARLGVRSLSKRAPMTRAVSLLRRGEFLGILPDQHGGRDGIRVPFFGVPTSTSLGSAAFAYLTGLPIVPLFSHRIAPCRHKLTVFPPLEWKRAADRDATIEEITVKVNRAMERMVLEAPDQWLAQHKRFKELYGGGREKPVPR